jgi:predicted kinase
VNITPSHAPASASTVPRLLIVNGLSASGKSTLGKEVAAALGLPFFSKDDFKETMFDHLGWSDSIWADRLGAASTEILWSITERMVGAGCSLVIESNFRAEFADPQLSARRAEQDLRAIELHCVTDRDVSVKRYINRAMSGERHPGHGERHLGELYTAKVPDLRQADDALLTTTDGYLIIDTTNPDAVDTETVATCLRDLLWPASTDQVELTRKVH